MKIRTNITKWRAGRRVGRTIYVQLGDEPSETDPLIGVMDTPELAAIVVEAVNEKKGLRTLPPSGQSPAESGPGATSQ